VHSASQTIPKITEQFGLEHPRKSHPGISGNPAWTKGVNGRKWAKQRALELAHREEEERRLEIAALIVDLGRVPSAAERILITEAASLVVEGRKLRSQGKSAIEQSRLLSRILGQLGVRDRVPPQQPVESYAELSRRVAVEADARRVKELAEDEARHRAENVASEAAS
jgi:hypothetical protein